MSTWWTPYFDRVNQGFKCKITEKNDKACGRFRKSPDSSTGTLWKHLARDHPKICKQLKAETGEKKSDLGSMSDAAGSAKSPQKKKLKVRNLIALI